MDQRNGRQTEGSSAPGTPAWMVTFSDCMTLLLCFFVLLLTFSSFDKVSLQSLGKAFPGMSHKSIFPNKRTAMDSAIPPRSTVADHTDEGSEKPTEDPPRDIENPKQFDKSLDPDVYCNRHVIRVPSDRLFFAKGSSLTGDGKRLGKMIATFVRKLPCNVVITEACPVSAGIVSNRALALVTYFTEVEGLSPSRFSLSVSGEFSAGAMEARPEVQITLFRGGLYR